MTLKHEDVEQILRIIDQSSTREVHLEHDGFKLVVRRHGGAGPITELGDAPAIGAVPSAAPAAIEEAPPSSRAAPPSATAVPLPAPLSGNFYRAPAPGADPFVEEGDRVTEEDTVCILDLMKVMNTLKAPCAGTVLRIDAHDEEAVSADQALMWIEPG